MAVKRHEIRTYNYGFDARTGVASVLQLWGDKGLIAQARFVDDASPVPPPVFSPDLNNASVSFKRSTLPGLIDMLRNESPVFVSIHDQLPGFVFITTTNEPIGEEESP
jgi:hypothetical protein